MSYAIRQDGLGWRSVGGPEDVAPNEYYSVEQPAPIIVAEPAPVDPVEKLRQFLAANPDVAALMQ